jgi:RHS repeat-associated protein
MYVLISLAVGWIGVGMLEDEIDRVLNERYSKDELKKSGVENKFFVKKTSDDSLFSYPSNNPKKLKTTPVVPYERGSQSSLSKQTKNNLTKMTALGVVLLLVSVASAGVMVGFWMQNLSPRQTEVSKVGDGLFTGDDPEDGGKGVTPGTIPGSFTVDALGQASYSMPIEVPPGTAGMQPSLSVNYNSMTGNGILGVGFSLGGLSVITRDSCNFEPDGYLATRFSDEGRFALDGMRLVRADGENYTYQSLMDYLTSSPNMQSVEFRKLLDDNTRITAWGSSGHSGLAYFIVELDNGLILTYGYTTVGGGSDGRIRQWYYSPAPPHSYALTSVQDSYGNYMVYKYEKESGSGAFYLSKIQYDGNNVVFSYESREDIIVSYDNGAYFYTPKRLAKIETFADGGLKIFSYLFSYEYGATSGKSRLVSIQQFDSTGSNFLNPTIFEWNDLSEPGYVHSESSWGYGTAISMEYFYKPYVMDINGDSLLDIVAVFDIGAACYQVFLQKDNGSFEPYFDGEFIDQRDMGDLDPINLVSGDYKIDKDWQWYYSNVDIHGRSNFRPGEQYTYSLFKPGELRGGYLGYNPMEKYVGKYLPHLTGGYMTRINEVLGNSVMENTQFIPMDFTGDGKMEFLKIFRNEYMKTTAQIWVANDEYIFEYLTTEVLGDWNTVWNGETLKVERFLILDVNGDGKYDVARIFETVPSNQLWLQIWPSNGDSFDEPWPAQELEGGGETYSVVDEYLICDIDGVGRDDIIRIRHQPYDDKPIVEVYMNRINWDAPEFEKFDYFIAESWGCNTQGPEFFEKWSSFHLIDINEDGHLDLVQIGAKEQNSLDLVIHAYISHGTGIFYDYLYGYGPLDRFIEDFYQEFPPQLNYYPLDVDGDRKADIVESRFSDDNSGDVFLNWSKTDYMPSVSFEILPQDLGEFTDTDRIFMNFVDINKDGAMDIVKIREYTDDTLAFITTVDSFLSSSNMVDKVFSISDGMDIVREITYVPVKSVYLGDSGLVANNTRHYLPALWVVSSVEVSSGSYVGSTEQYASVSYEYGGGKLHTHGFGFLGFETFIAHEYYNDSSVRTVRTFYNQMFPYIGRVKGRFSGVVEQGVEVVLSHEQFFYDYEIISNSRYQVIYLGSVSYSYEYPTGILLSKTSLSLKHHDAFGYPQQIIKDVYDGSDSVIYSSVENITYEHRVNSPCFIGLVTSEKKSEDTGNGPRVSEVEYSYTDNGSIFESKIEPNMGDMGLVTRYGYDGYGNIIEMSSSYVVNGVTYEIIQFQAQYDSRGRFMLWEKNAKNHQITYTGWDSGFGLPLIVTDANGLTTSYEYDGFGRVKQIIDADGVKTKMFYNFNDGAMAATKYRVKTETTGQPVSRVYYDKFGRVTETLAEGINGQGIRTRSYYDMFGRVIQQSQPYFSGDAKYYTYYDYDILDRVTTITQPFSESAPYEPAITSYGYDGFSTTITDPLGFELVERNNALGQLVEIENALHQITSFEYDSSGNLIRTVDPAGVVKVWNYDVRNRVSMHSDPNGGFHSFSYNALNQVVEKVDNKGQIFEMAYDDLGRMIRMDYDEGYNVWVYDEADYGVGKLWKSQRFNNPTSLESETEIAYDELGRLKVQSKSFDGTSYYFSYSYDDYSRLRTMTYPTGVRIKYEYDNGYNTKIKRAQIMRADTIKKTINNTTPVLGVSPPGGDEKHDQSSYVTRWKPVWELVEMSPFGSVAVERFGNQVVTTSDFNKASGFLEGIVSVHQNFDDLFIQDIGYEYDFNGNVVERSVGFMNDAVWDYLVEGFSYDALNRLVSTSGTATAATIEYDLQTGNIYKKSDIGPESFGMYYYGGNQPNAVDEIKGYVTGVGFTTVLDFSYDGNGNMVTKNNIFSGEKIDAEYNSFNKIAWVNKHINNISQFFVSYSYDEMQNKVSTVEVDSNSQSIITKRYISDFYEEYTQHLGGNADEKRHYIYAAGRPVAIKTLVEDKEDIYHGEIRYLHRDGLGSVEVITDDLGGVVERFSYDAWGKRRNVDGTVLDGLFDDEFTDRGFTGHRHVDSLGLIDMKARMYDPQIAMFLSVDPLGGGYRYCYNNPLKFTDPTGLKPKDQFIHLLALVEIFGERIYPWSVTIGIVHGRSALARFRYGLIFDGGEKGISGGPSGAGGGGGGGGRGGGRGRGGGGSSVPYRPYGASPTKIVTIPMIPCNHIPTPDITMINPEPRGIIYYNDIKLQNSDIFSNILSFFFKEPTLTLTLYDWFGYAIENSMSISQYELVNFVALLSTTIVGGAIVLPGSIVTMLLDGGIMYFIPGSEGARDFLGPPKPKKIP